MQERRHGKKVEQKSSRGKKWDRGRHEKEVEHIWSVKLYPLAERKIAPLDPKALN